MIKRLSLALALGFALTACSESEQSQAAGNAEPAHTSEVKINVPTVQCGSCQANIESALKELEGVKSATVDLNAKITQVSYDAMKVDLAALENAVAMAGYDANNIKRDSTVYAGLEACCKLPGDR